MILPNRILLFLIGCTIVVPCLGAKCPEIEWVSNICDKPGAEVCDCTIETISDCPTGYDTCNKVTLKVVGGTVIDVCDKDSYIAYCNNVELNLSYILNTLKNNHYRLKDKCWAVDGSLTTNQHYQNMRELFNSNTYSGGIIDDAIARMDFNSRKLEAKGGCGSGADCDSSDSDDINSSKCALKLWRDMTHVACANAMNQSGGVTCTKCPNNGETLGKSWINLNRTQVTLTVLTKIGTNVLIEPITPDSFSDYAELPAEWKSFNTIADCYITQGTDERGEFELGHDTYKCYYSKE